MRDQVQLCRARCRDVRQPDRPGGEQITLNGEPVPPGAFDGERIALADLAAENVLVVDAECAYSRSGEGLHRFADPADGNVYLYSQPGAVRRAPDLRVL